MENEIEPKKTWWKRLRSWGIWYLNKLQNWEWEEDLDRFFDQIALLAMTPEQKEEAVLSVKEGVMTGRLYWGEIILSSLIATFGLLQNSVAVIIGAMLIAPLFQPIQGMGFALATGDSQLFWRATKLLIGSVLVSVGVAWIAILVVPVQLETSEILARTAPNLYDFFIAVFSAAIAALALSFKRLSSSVAGVAMAASLMPPLAVAGIELGLVQWPQVWGSSFLFITNLVAIVLVMMIAFWAYGFAPHRQESQSAVKKIALLLLSVAILWFPLGAALSRVSEQIQTQNIAAVFVKEKLNSLIPEATLSQLQIETMQDDSVDFFGVIKLPEKVSFFNEIHDQMTQGLSEKLGRSVTIDLELIRTARLQKKSSPTVNVPDEIKTKFREIFALKFPESTLIQLDVFGETGKDFNVKAIVVPPVGTEINPEIQAALLSELSVTFSRQPVDVIWTILGQSLSEQASLSQSEQKTIPEQFRSAILNDWEQFLQQKIPRKSELKNMDVFWKISEKTDQAARSDENEPETVETFREKITGLTFRFDLIAPQNFSADLAAAFQSEIQSYATQFDFPVQFEWRMFSFSSFE